MKWLDKLRPTPDRPTPPPTMQPIRHGGKRPDRLEINKWEMSRHILSLVDIVNVTPYPLDELLLMAAAFDYHRPELVVEIGTHVGVSGRLWYELSQASGIDTEIHTIDLCDPTHPEDPGKELGRLFRGLPVKQHIGDGCDVARTLLEERPGMETLLFLDGDHRYESVCRELELADLIKRGGVLLHDTFYQPESTYNHGPYEAIQTYLESHEPAQLIHQHNGLPGMTYLRPR